MNTDYNLDAGLSGAHRALEALEALDALKTSVGTTEDENTLRIALMSLEDLTDQYGLTHQRASLEQAELKSSFSQRISALMQEAWQALVKFLKWITKVINEAIVDSSLRTESVAAGFANTRSVFENNRKQGKFKAPSAGRLNNRRILTRLSIGEGIEFNALIAGVGFLNTLTDKLERYSNREIRKLKRFNLAAAVTNIESEENYELPTLTPFDASQKKVDTKELVARGFSGNVLGLQSRVLPGNKCFLYVYQDPDVSESKTNSRYGLYFTDVTPEAEEKTSPALAVFAALNDHEMMQLLMITQGLVNTIRQNDTSLREIRRVAEQLARSVENAKNAALSQEEIKDIKNTLVSTIRSLAVCGTEYRRYSLNVVEAIAAYVRLSMDKYK